MNSYRLRKVSALFTAWAIALIAVLPVPTYSTPAQATTGTLRGVVVDTNGGAIAGANVTAKNEGAGITAPATNTTGEGAFEFSGLPPGSYTVAVEAAGFKRSNSVGVLIKAGIVNPLRVKLEAGDVAETVTVTAGAEEVVQREQSQLSHTVDRRRIEELPSNAAGNGLDTLALLAPGVIPNSSGGVNTSGTGLSVNDHQQLLRAVRPQPRHHRQLRDQVGRERVPRQRLRVPPRQQEPRQPR